MIRDPCGLTLCAMGRYWVYILASRRNGTLYIGLTNLLAHRMDEHKRGLAAFNRDSAPGSWVRSD